MKERKTWAALTLLLAVSACTSGSTPQASAPSPSTSAAPSTSASPLTSSPDVDDASPDPEPSYRPLRASETLAGVEPISTSFVSTRTGWFLGRRTCGAQTCGVLLQTRDGGRTFRRRNAPPVNVASVRFADLNQGWAFGNGRFDRQNDPGLWRTHDGGQTWRRIGTHPVPSLEIGAGNVWVVDSGGDGTSPQLFRGNTHADVLRQVLRVPNRAGTVVVGHGTAYLIAQSTAGPLATVLLAVSPTSTQQRQNPCGSGDARTLQVAVGRPAHLTAICSGEPSAGSQIKRAYATSDDGRTWRQRPDPPGAGYTGDFDGSVAATSRSVFMTGGRNGINKETGTGPWRRVLLDEDGSGFSFVGFTDDAHGVAIGQRAAWLSDDAGEHWRRLRFS